MHKISKSIFYGHNYFEIKDEHYANRHSPTDLACRNQLAHHFLELMSCSKARDETPHYGDRPLNLMCKTNIDIDFCIIQEEGDYGGQTPWHFERIVDAVIAMPRLKKLVINVQMIQIVEILQLPDYDVDNLDIHPEIWPGWRRLPWAASALLDNSPRTRERMKGREVLHSRKPEGATVGPRTVGPA